MRLSNEPRGDLLWGLTTEFSGERSDYAAMLCQVPDAQAQEYIDDQRQYVQLLTFSDQHR